MFNLKEGRERQQKNIEQDKQKTKSKMACKPYNVNTTLNVNNLIGGFMVQGTLDF